MLRGTITHLIIAAGGNGATGRVVDELQKDGMSVSAATANTKHELAALLREPHWEALICFDNTELSTAVVLSLVAQCINTIPVILLTRAEKVADFLPMLDLGISDVVPEQQTKRVFLSVHREAVNSRLKREVVRLVKNHTELEDEYRSILSSSVNPTSYIHDGAHLYCNQSYVSLFGFENIATLTSTPLLNLIQPRDHSLIKKLLAQPPEKEESLVIKVLHRNAGENEMRLTFVPVEFQRKPCLRLTMYPSAGMPKQDSSKVKDADIDLPGNLFSRTQFAEQLETAIAMARDKGVLSSLLVITVNQNIAIRSNEDNGKPNLMNSDIARFLEDVIDKPFFAARLDDYVFGILLSGDSTDEVAALDALLKDNINRYFTIAGMVPGEQNSALHNILIHGREQNAESVLAQASRNLKDTRPDEIESKTKERNTGTTSDVDSDMLEYLLIALTQKRFKLLYQPVVHIKGANHKGYEVLSRMLDRDGNDILPEAFISAANQSGIGEKLDKLIITIALDSMALSAKSSPLLINISNNTLMSRTFLPWLGRQLEQRKIPMDLFSIVISETDIHNNEGHAIDFCRGLNTAGLKFVISRFGCIPDIYAVLAEIKPAMVKLDSSLLKDIGRNPLLKTKVQTVVGNLHNRSLLVVAPQVESLAILPILWDTGIDYVQGYCLQAPSHEMNYNFLVEEEITLSAGRI